MSEPDMRVLWHFPIAADRDADEVDDGRVAGFCDWPDGFEVQVWRLDADGGPEGIEVFPDMA